MNHSRFPGAHILDDRMDRSRSSSSVLVNLLIERWDLDPVDIAYWVQSIDGNVSDMSERDRIAAGRIKGWYTQNLSRHGYQLPRAREPEEGWGRVRALRKDPNDRLAVVCDMILREVLLRSLAYKVSIPWKWSEIRHPEILIAHEHDRANTGAHLIARYRIAGNNRTIAIRTAISDGGLESMPEDGKVVLAYYNVHKWRKADNTQKWRKTDDAQNRRKADIAHKWREVLDPLVVYSVRPEVMARVLRGYMRLTGQGGILTPDETYDLFIRIAAEIPGEAVTHRLAQVWSDVQDLLTKRG